MQAKHIDMDDLLVLLLIMSRTGRRQDQHDRWVSTSEIWQVWNDQQALTPFKVMAAKLSRLLRKGLVEGCDCGCRGDWHLSTAGLGYLIEKGHLTPA